MSINFLFFNSSICFIFPAFSACNDPGDVENSNRDLVGLEEGDTVNYTCNVGYKVKNLNALTVTTIRTCQNGNWSDGQPVCEGKTQTDAYIFRYACNYDYYLKQGSATFLGRGPYRKTGFGRRVG